MSPSRFMPFVYKKKFEGNTYGYLVPLLNFLCFHSLDRIQAAEEVRAHEEESIPPGPYEAGEEIFRAQVEEEAAAETIQNHREAKMELAPISFGSWEQQSVIAGKYDYMIVFRGELGGITLQLKSEKVKKVKGTLLSFFR